ncbi:MAG: hypothetical protein HRF48_01355 [Chloroflexota bacterium]
MAEGKRGSSCLKGLGGIMAAVITAVLVWWLTAPGGLLNPEDATQAPRPVLKIVDFQVGDAPVGGQARAEVTVFNEGDSTGEFCTVWWYSGSEVAHRLEQGLLPGQAAVSGEFGLRPQESKQITVWSLPYGEPGRFRSLAEVTCSGTNITSAQFVAYVTVK